METKIKVVALDLDGTLLNSNHKISEENKRIIGELKKIGVEVILCTGRPYNAMKNFKFELGLENPVICFNGASVIDSNEEFLLSTTLSSEISKELVKVGENYNVYHHGFVGNNWLIPFFDDEAKSYKERTGLEETLVNFDDLEEFPFIKMMYIGEKEVLDKIFNELEYKFNDEIYKAFSNNRYLEVLNPKSSKAKALDFYLKSKGLSKENLLTMGDGFNDKEMLEFAEVGVVMENAPEEMKKGFKYIAPSNDENGVGVFLKEFFKL